MPKEINIFPEVPHRGPRAAKVLSANQRGSRAGTVVAPVSIGALDNPLIASAQAQAQAQAVSGAPP